MRKHSRSLVACLALAVAAALVSTAQGAEEIAATVGDRSITLQELDEAMATELTRIRQQEYELRRQGLDKVLADLLLQQEADSRGISVEELIEIEVRAKITKPTEAQIDKFYQPNKGRITRSREEMAPAIERLLERQGREVAQKQYVQELMKKANVRIMLEPPRSEIAIPPGEPSRGSPDAPITIVEFSDFQCPYCKRAHPTIEQLLSEYGEQIYFVYRDFPLGNHPRAVPAAEAARCAGDQDGYWAYYDNLMTAPGNLADEDLTKRAGDVGLDTAAFTECLQSGRHRDAVDAAQADGAALGVTGTPAFFINGRVVSGAKPLATFQQIINDELQRVTADSE